MTNRAVAPPPSSALPPLPLESKRPASYTPYIQTGTQDYAASGATDLGGGLLKLDSTTPGSLAYAIYRFNATSADIIDSLQYQVSDKTVSDNNIFIGLSDYEFGRWKILDPHTSDTADYPMGNGVGRYVSPGGYIYVVMLATGGQDYTVNQVEVDLHDLIDPTAPLARISADPVSGVTPLSTTFKLSDSYDTDGTIVKYELDFEDDGTYDLTQNDASDVGHTYNTDGAHTCRLRVTDNDNKTGEETVEVVSGLGDVPAGWAAYPIATLPNLSSETVLLRSIGGMPAVMLRNGVSPYEFQYIYATKPEPGIPADWTEKDVDSTINGQFFDLLDNNGTPIMVCKTDNTTPQHLVFAKFNGTAWIQYVLDEIPQHTAGEYCHLAIVGGKPAVAYERYHGGVEHLAYARANVTDPTQASDWTLMEIDTAYEPNKITGLVESGGVPMFCFGRRNGSTNAVGIAYATSETPSAPADWVNYEAYTDAAQAYAELYMVGGLPAMIVNNASPSPNETRLLRADTPIPLASADWIPQVFEASYDSSGWGTGDWGGTPFIIADLGPGGLHLYHSLSADPQSYLDWDNSELFPPYTVNGLTAAEMPFGRPALLAERSQENSIYYMFKTP